MTNDTDFKKQVIKALHQGIITKQEAKECILRGFGKQEVPIFYFDQWENSSLRIYVDALEKMEMIKPLIRLNND